MFSTLIWFFYWLITCSRKPKVPGLSPNRPANVQVSEAGGSGREESKKYPSSSPAVL